MGAARGDREASARQAFENFRFFGAPHVAVITTDAVHDVYGAVDSGLYVGSFLLAARSLGLGAIPQAALAGHATLIRRHFDLAPDRKVLVGISFGYADNDHPANGYRTARASLDVVVTWVHHLVTRRSPARGPGLDRVGSPHLVVALGRFMRAADQCPAASASAQNGTASANGRTVDERRHRLRDLASVVHAYPTWADGARQAPVADSTDADQRADDAPRHRHGAAAAPGRHETLPLTTPKPTP